MGVTTAGVSTAGVSSVGIDIVDIAILDLATGCACIAGVAIVDRFSSQVTQKCPRIRFLPVSSPFRN